ncbi:translation initiation factor IF-2 [Prolixibacter denitrificans]|uniref:Translation initiation factor IF-2 n=1 Tax=Prolixibacter denitrificans TaxID=1541063 RepID=A0A2P8CI64_9BACT|nr:translation initiation factor IF-2 [Prolixibacter denitrificans]PSK84677.1 translation initiation factor IF-2 [Prolixibacter denitrificans]GET20843.1 translation initiation factor IF-2 [Prolixibacter denitrificans]
MVVGNKGTRLSKIARELNVGISTLVDYLQKQGVEISSNPNTKIDDKTQEMLEKQFRKDHEARIEANKVNLRQTRSKKESVSLDDVHQEENADTEEEDFQDDDSIRIADHSSSAHRAEEKKQQPSEEPPKPKQSKEPTPPAPEKKEKEDKPKVKVVGHVDLENVGPKKAPKEEEKKETPKTEKAPEKKEPVPSPESSEKEKKQEQDKSEKAPKQEKKEPGKTEKPAAGTPPEAEKSDKKESASPKAEDKVKVVGKVDLDSMKPGSKQTKETPKKQQRPTPGEQEARKKPQGKGKEKEQSQEANADNGDEIFKLERKKLSGPTVVGKIDLPQADKRKPGNNKNKKDEERQNRRKKRKRIQKDPKERVSVSNNKKDNQPNKQQHHKDGGKRGDWKKKPNRKKNAPKKEVSEEDVQKQIKETLARLTSKGQKSKGSKYRREKRHAVSEKMAEEMAKAEQEKNVIKVTEFVSVNELANMIDVPVTKIIETCMNLGLFVSINQRLDAETMALVADEFGYTVEFISVEVQEAIMEEDDTDEEMQPRPPIVTVMGHVDHGKTSLLDYIRKTNVIAGEAGGITQHIGAYNVTLEDNRKITFLDTPGHEAFTAMRARGAQITDIAIIIIAADDNVMPQTIEAINHASAAGVPIIFAINKVDKPGANPERIKEELANMNYLVEEWGGKYQSQDISAKSGNGIEELMEKVLLEAEMLDLQANPDKRAVGSVIESSLDKGRGYVATVLVQAGTLRVGDVILAGQYFGHVKAMFNERNQRIEEVGPSEPTLILGLNGAPQAGDKFNVMEEEKEARQIANKREQLQREQGLRTQKHITLDEIGRRIAIGNFQELNVIVKGDVDGSIEALSDSLIKLSTQEIQVNVIHKAVGQITESDVMLATASNAIIIGFQVRPSINARRIAEKEEIDIRLYSIIYDAINEIKSAMEGMLAPEIKEEIQGTAEIMTTFKITKVGTIAGCIVRDGKITRNAQVRVIRDGIVVYTGVLGSLKRFKDDVKEVARGYECGLNIEGYNDIKEGDFVEAFTEVEVAKKLK